MKLKDIHKIIEKFYDGETSEQEERLLKEFFGREEIPEELSAEKAYFISITEIGDFSLDETFDQKLMKQISEKSSGKSFRLWTYSLSGVAATIAIFMAVWFSTDIFSPKEVYGTIEDPNMAFMETRKAIEEVSGKMNKGLSPAKKTVNKVEENVQKAGEIKRMNEALDNVKKLQKLDNTSDFIKSFSKVYVNYGNS